MGETLDLLACHLIGGFADSCGAVPGTAGDGDKNIGPRPGVFVPDGAELVKADLELRGAVLQRRAFLQLSAFVSTAQSDEFRAGAVEPIIEGPELQPSQETLDPCDVVVVLRTDEQMHVDEAALCRDVQTQLDVREDKLDVRQASLLPTPAEHFFIGVGYVVVRNGDGFDLGRGRLQGGQVVIPGVRPAELIVEHGPRRVDMRLPPTPFRSSTQHFASHCVFLSVMRVWRTGAS